MTRSSMAGERRDPVSGCRDPVHAAQRLPIFLVDRPRSAIRMPGVLAGIPPVRARPPGHDIPENEIE
jgi:hypothetical protein